MEEFVASHIRELLFRAIGWTDMIHCHALDSVCSFGDFGDFSFFVLFCIHLDLFQFICAKYCFDQTTKSHLT